MKRLLCFACCLVSCAAPYAGAADGAKEPGTMSAAMVIDRNVAARGGLSAWRAVSTLTLSGRMEAGGPENTDLPFVMRMKRPHKTRMEIRFEEETALQVYDGHQGWKVRPFMGRDEVEPYTDAEAREAAGWQELDGPLVDYAKKGTQASLMGTEMVEGRMAYKIRLTLKNGEQRNVWIDAASFLERKIDGEAAKIDGKLRSVTVLYRDYRKENGLMMPHVLETVVEGGESHKMYIEDVTLNEPMDEALFVKPDLALVRASAPPAEQRL